MHSLHRAPNVNADSLWFSCIVYDSVYTRGNAAQLVKPNDVCLDGQGGLLIAPGIGLAGDKGEALG